MGAPAITRPRTSPAPKRRPAARPTPRPAPRVGPVVRTAGAVGGLADCGLVMRLTRGRAWIVVLGILLGGIVAINVWGLGMSASSSATAAKIEALQRDNSVLAGRLASRTSNGTIETSAAALGLAVPAPDAVHYLGASPGDAEKAAERLANGKISPTPPPLPEATEPVVPAATTIVTDPAVTPVEPDPAVAPVTTPVEPASGTIDPVTGALVP